MTGIDCARCRELAPELALGVGSGDDRSAVLEHVAHCTTCERDLDELAVAADAVLLAAPSVEPPVGFETEVFTRIGAIEQRRRRSWRRTLVAAAVLAVLGVGLGLGFARREGQDGDAPARAFVPNQVAAGGLLDPEGDAAGEVFAYTGEPSWLVVRLDAGVPAGAFQVECAYEHGERFVAGTLTAGRDDGTTWMTAVPEDLATLTSVRLLPIGDSGTPLTAEITTS